MMRYLKQMTIFKLAILTFLQILILSVVIPSSILKVNAEAVTSTYIEDDADLFTLSEEEALAKEMKRLQNKYDVDIVILTVDDRGNISSIGYLDSYFDNQCDKDRKSVV